MLPLFTDSIITNRILFVAGPLGGPGWARDIVVRPGETHCDGVRVVVVVRSSCTRGLTEGVGVDVAREWMDLVGSLLAVPMTTVPEERLAATLITTFESSACAFHMRPARNAVVQRIYPVGRFDTAQLDEWVRLSVETPTVHPLMRYYLATGDRAPQQVADVPSTIAGPRARARYAELIRADGLEHQLAIPLPPRSSGARWFVVGRSTPYSPAAMMLARQVQRLIIGLDRQATALTRWQQRAAGGDGGSVATDVRLTPRELSVLGLVADGLTAAATARRLVVAERTVHKHLERVYAKLGVSDRVSAVLRAQRLGMLREAELVVAQ
jgi:DNA-binding CsgD family transcriptional regulator